MSAVSSRGRITFSEKTCTRCHQLLTFCFIFDLNKNRHVRVKCEPCRLLPAISVTKAMQVRYGIVNAKLPRHYTKLDKYAIQKEKIFFLDMGFTGEKWKEVEASGLPYWAYNGPGEWIYRVEDGLHVCMVDEIGIKPEPW